MTSIMIKPFVPLALLLSLAACALVGPGQDVANAAAGADAGSNTADAADVSTQGTPASDAGIAGSTGHDAAVDTPSPSATDTTGAREITLAPGAQVALADRSSLRYQRLVDDSRCPLDVQCIWAGDAEIELRWTPAEGDVQDVRLHTGKAPREQLIGVYRVTLVSLQRGPAPAARLRLEATQAGQ